MLREINFDSKKVPAFIDGALNSFELNKKTGILDVFNKCTVTAPINYATAGYGRITFNDGLLVVCGRAIYIESGTELLVPITSTAGGSIGVKVDLSQNAGSQVSFYSKTSQSLTQQDLNANRTDGIYEFEIFKYSSNGTILTLIYQSANLINSNETALNNIYTKTEINNLLEGTGLKNVQRGVETISYSVANNIFDITINNVNTAKSFLLYNIAFKGDTSTPISNRTPSFIGYAILYNSNTIRVVLNVSAAASGTPDTYIQWEVVEFN